VVKPVHPSVLRYSWVLFLDYDRSDLYGLLFRSTPAHGGLPVRVYCQVLYAGAYFTVDFDFLPHILGSFYPSRLLLLLFRIAVLL